MPNRFQILSIASRPFKDSKPWFGKRQVNRSSKSNSAGIKQVKEKHELNYKYNTNTNTCETGAMTNRV